MGQRVGHPVGGNVPVIASTFVGRQQELVAVRRELEASRLVTLTGPGGVGKTRLAVEVGSLAQRAFPNGVWLVDLATLQDDTRLAETVAVTLGVGHGGVGLANDALFDELAACRLMVILDNCEHLVVACAQLIDRLLRRCPSVRVLATTREPLAIAGEHVMSVNPLPVPAATALPLEILARCPSVALFVDRAAAVQPTFRLRADNAEATAQICLRLDGLPLAIELAATRMRSLSVEQVADRLDDRFALLTRGSPAADSRHQTLRVLVDWSYDLCTRQQRLLWARLSVFPGDFDLAAVEAICTGPDISTADVLDLIDGLVTKCVVTARFDSGTARYHLLESLRAYGADRLAEGDEESMLRQRHRDHYFHQAIRLCETWRGADQAGLIAWFNIERENLASALSWSLAQPGELHTALAVVSALRHHWLNGGYLANGPQLFRQFIDAFRQRPEEREYALWVASTVVFIQGDVEAASAWFCECATFAGARPDDRIKGYALVLSGSKALLDGAVAQAAEYLRDGLALLRQHDDVEATLWGLFQYSVALSQSGDSRAAQAVCAEAIALAEERGELWAKAAAIWASGFDLLVSGDPEGAADVVRRALAIVPTNNRVGAVLDVELLAWIAAREARYEEAARLLGSSAAVWESLGTTIEAFGPIVSRYSAECRMTTLAALGPERFSALEREGRADPNKAFGRREGEAGAMPAPCGGTLLTPRERDVALLIAKGLTNREIATELVLSRRTIDGHVERLFAKIGVTRRAQVAGWIAQHEDELGLARAT